MPVLLDKNFVQGFSKGKELSDSFNTPLVTKGLLIEILSNLRKEDKHDPENFVEGLFQKIKGVPIFKNYDQLIKEEFFHGKTITMMNDFFGYGVNTSDCSLEQILEEDMASANQGARWERGEFIDDDKNLADDYRQARKEKFDEIKAFLSKFLKERPAFSMWQDDNAICSTMDQKTPEEQKVAEAFEKSWNQPFNEPTSIIEHIKSLNVKPEFISGMLLHLISPKTDAEEYAISDKLASHGFSALYTFAPYTSYVITILALYHFWYLPTTHHNNNMSFKKSKNDFVDINYLFYLPFVDSIASNDKIFGKFIEKSSLMPYFHDRIKIISRENN